MYLMLAWLATEHNRVKYVWEDQKLRAMVLVTAEGNNWKLDYMMSKLFKKQKLHNVKKRKKKQRKQKKGRMMN